MCRRKLASPTTSRSRAWRQQLVSHVQISVIIIDASRSHIMFRVWFNVSLFSLNLWYGKLCWICHVLNVRTMSNLIVYVCPVLGFSRKKNKKNYRRRFGASERSCRFADASCESFGTPLVFESKSWTAILTHSQVTARSRSGVVQDSGTARRARATYAWPADKCSTHEHHRSLLLFLALVPSCVEPGSPARARLPCAYVGVGAAPGGGSGSGAHVTHAPGRFAAASDAVTT
jgi:hypothetical protein